MNPAKPDNTPEDQQPEESVQMQELREIQAFIGGLPAHFQEAILNCTQAMRRLACTAPPEIAAAAIGLLAAESAAGVLDVALQLTHRQMNMPKLIMPGEKRII